jgi:large subunit ribosomal protein L29
MSDDELSRKEEELAQELYNLRFQRAVGQLANIARVNQVKRDRARVKTILAERGRRS